MKPSTALKFVSCAGLLFPVVVIALEIAQPKLGLWEMRAQKSYDGAPLTVAGTTQICVNAVELESSKKILEEVVSKNCSKNEVRKEGGKWIMDSVCKISGAPYSGQMTREFNGENAYRDDTTLTYNPPLGGHSRVHVAMDGRWLGPCK